MNQSEEQIYDRSVLEASLSQFESAVFNFAQRSINDSQVRRSYIAQTGELSRQYHNKVKIGSLSVDEAARQVNAIRNEIMETERLRSSDIGKAIAEKLKESGSTLDNLTENML